MSLKFVYTTSSGQVITKVSELMCVLNPVEISHMPAEVMCLIAEQMDVWTKLNFGLTCKTAFRASFDGDCNPKSIVLNAGFTKVTRWAAKSPDIAKRLKAFLGLRPLPLSPKYSLFDHQVKAIKFMREREVDALHGIRGGIIQMKMGLGKSLVAIAHSLTSKRPQCREKYGENGFPTLVIASKTVIKEWKSEGFAKFFGERIKVLYLHAEYLKPSVYKTVSRSTIVKYDIVVTSYDVIRSVGKTRGYTEEIKERGGPHTLQNGKVIAINLKTRGQADKPHVRGPGVIFGTPWERVIADESQIFANPKTLIFQAMLAVYGRNKWCLTGTPMPNRGSDLWAQLRFCGYNKVSKQREWNTPIMKAHQLGSAILQMDHKDANMKLPPKKNVELEVSLDGTEKEMYDYAHGVGKSLFRGMLAQKIEYSQILAMFMRLRQCCIAPYLILDKAKRNHSNAKPKITSHLKEAFKGKYAKWVADKDGEAGIKSKKMSAVINTLRLVPDNEKVLVFSSFTSALDLLKYGCSKILPKMNILQLDGCTESSERGAILTKFKTDPKVKALFLCYKIGAEGLNLTQANHVICLEPWWNEAVHDQAISRAWRFGQSKTVRIYRPLVTDSIEDKMIAICQEKKKIEGTFLSDTFESSGLDIRTMGQILGVY